MLSSLNYPSKHRLSSLFPLKHQPPSLAPSKRLSHQRFMKKNIETLFGGSVLFSILSPFYNYHHAVYQLFNIVTVIFKCASKCPTLLLEFTVNCPTHCPTTIFKHATIWTFDHITSISKYTGDRPIEQATAISKHTFNSPAHPPGIQPPHLPPQMCVLRVHWLIMFQYIGPVEKYIFAFPTLSFYIAVITPPIF